MKSLLVTAVLVAFSTTALAQQTESRTGYDRDTKGAGVFIEPIVQFSQLDSEIKTSQLPIISDNTSGKSEGAGIGLRLGGHVSDVIFLGIDGRYSKLQFNDSAYGDAEGSISISEPISDNSGKPKVVPFPLIL